MFMVLFALPGISMFRRYLVIFMPYHQYQDDKHGLSERRDARDRTPWCSLGVAQSVINQVSSPSICQAREKPAWQLHHSASLGTFKHSMRRSSKAALQNRTSPSCAE